MKDGKSDAALVAALTDKNAARRGGAGSVLARAGAADQRDAVRKLLADPEPAVRYRVAMALIAAKDKAGLPVLIDLLVEVEEVHVGDTPLPSQDVGAIECLLHHIAGDKGPAPATGTDAPARRKYRDSWLAWWKENGKDLDAAKLAQLTRNLGCTLVVLLDQGTVMDLDGQKKPRFQIKGLEFPLDVQYLPGDHVLVAEHNGNVVTERDKANTVRVEERSGPTAGGAAACPTATPSSPPATNCWRWTRPARKSSPTPTPAASWIMRARNCSNGDIAMVTQLGMSRYRPPGQGPQGNRELSRRPWPPRAAGSKCCPTATC